MQGQKLSESVTFDGAKFDEAEGVRTIKNVALLGQISKNGYKYRKEAMQRAVNGGLYDGVRIFINHPTKEEERTGRRDTMKLAGQAYNARFEDGKIKGDIKLLDDEQGGKFWSIAKTAPGIASCSHVADGKLVSAGREKFVEDITKVLSVDLVVQGATTSSVFENLDAEVKTMDFEDIKIDDLRIKRKDLVDVLAKEGAMSRNDEVQALLDEVKTLKVTVDDFQVKEAAAQKSRDVQKMLDEAKLPKDAITDIFIETLTEIDGDDWRDKAKHRIEDRRKMLGGVKNMGGGQDPPGNVNMTAEEAAKRL